MCVCVCVCIDMHCFRFTSLLAICLVLAVTVAELDVCSFADQPVTQEQIVEKLRTKGISDDDAKLYAAKFLRAKFTTPRQLAALTKPELKELEVAMGHQAVTLEAFTEWIKGLSSIVTGAAIHSYAASLLVTLPFTVYSRSIHCLIALSFHCAFTIYSLSIPCLVRV
jgi:hypothetical protein